MSWSAPPPSAVGSLSAEGAEAFWKEGSQLFEKGQYSDSIFYLRKVSDQAPSFKEYTKLQFLLGRAYVLSGKPQLAFEPLKFAIKAYDWTVDGMNARLWLARAYHEAGKNHEAFLTADEVLLKTKPKQKTDPASAVHMRALLIKAQALMGLNKDNLALQSIDSFRTGYNPKTIPSPGPGMMMDGLLAESLRSEGYLVEIEHKLRECNRLPGKGLQSESAVRNQMERRGNCLLEAFNYYQSILRLAELEPLKRAEAELVSGVKGFNHACLNPPNPPGKRSAKKLKQYKAELVYVLKQDCRKTTAQAVGMLGEWGKDISTDKKEFLESLTHLQKVLATDRG